MRSSKFVIALAGSAALVAAPLAATASASGTGSNTGSATVTGETREAGTTTVAKKFKVYDQPTDKYVDKSCAIDLSGIPDFSLVDEVTGCGFTATFDVQLSKQSVPNGGWGSWGSPPDTEDATPDVLWTFGATTLTVSYDKKIKTGGMEIEPNLFGPASITADFYKKTDGGGKLIGSITRDDLDGQSGAKLFGTKAKKGFKSVVITHNEGSDFAIAQLRG